VPKVQASSGGLRGVGDVLSSWPGLLENTDLVTCRMIATLGRADGGENGPKLTTMPSPESLGGAYELGLDTDQRSTQGSWFTPRPLATGIAERALGALITNGSDSPITVLDPACGGGAFLLATIRELIRMDGDPEAAFGAVTGFDLDDDALLVARAALELLTLELGVSPKLAELVTLEAHNFLTFGPAASGQMSLSEEPDAFLSVDLVIGNAPFQSQLRARTSRDSADRKAMARTLGDAASGYVDTAALFLLRSLDCVAASGTVALIVPASTLASRDASEVRAQISQRSSIVHLWRDGVQRAFDGGVPVCAVFLERGTSQGAVSRTQGLDFAAMPAMTVESEIYSAGRWGRLLIDQSGLPSIPWEETHRSLGDMANVTADFRDQYYGLVGLVNEADEGPLDSDARRLAVTGTIDPASFRWGLTNTRFNKSDWLRPVVELKELASSELSEWGNARLVPKLLVATQTRILEAYVDHEGLIVPCPPLISVMPQREDIWLIAALLNSPASSAWAIFESAGSALSLDAIKLSATQLRRLPLPQHEPPWHEAAAIQEKAHRATDDDERRRLLLKSAIKMGAAFGVRDEAAAADAEWWDGRLVR
jgi:hypothetical protein